MIKLKLWLFVNINEEVANQHDGAPFQLWDFSGYNSYNTRDNCTLMCEFK